MQLLLYLVNGTYYYGITADLKTTFNVVSSACRYIERSEIEVLYFHINTQLKSLNQPAFTPQDGQLIHDLERSWENLERAEHRREVALREELLRQERLEQLNNKFERKVTASLLSLSVPKFD